MVGVGETKQEIIEVMQDLRNNQVDMLTIGQYLQPSKHHLAVERYVHPDEFAEYEKLGYEMGFSNVASGPMVRSSYHADVQASATQTNKADALTIVWPLDKVASDSKIRQNQAKNQSLCL